MPFGVALVASVFLVGLFFVVYFGIIGPQMDDLLEDYDEKTQKHIKIGAGIVVVLIAFFLWW